MFFNNVKNLIIVLVLQVFVFSNLNIAYVWGLAVSHVPKEEQLGMKETAKSLKDFKIKKSLEELAGDEKFTIAQFIEKKRDFLDFGLLNKDFYANSIGKNYFWKDRLFQKFGKFIETENGQPKTYFNFFKSSEKEIDWKQAYKFLTFHPIKDEALARNLIETLGYLLLFTANVPEEFWKYLSKLYPEGSNKPKIVENFINVSNKTLDLEEIQNYVLKEILENYDTVEKEKYCIEILENNLWNKKLFEDIIGTLEKDREEFLLKVFRVFWKHAISGSSIELLYSDFSVKLIGKIEELGLQSFTRNEVWRCIEEKTEELLNNYTELDSFLFISIYFMFSCSKNTSKMFFFKEKIRIKEKENLDTNKALLEALRMMIKGFFPNGISIEMKRQMAKAEFEMGRKMYEHTGVGLNLIDKFVYHDLVEILKGFIETVNQKGTEKEKKKIEEVLLKYSKKCENISWWKAVFELCNLLGVDRFVYEDLYEVLKGFVEVLMEQKAPEKEKKKIEKKILLEKKRIGKILLESLKKCKDAKWKKGIFELCILLEDEEIRIKAEKITQDFEIEKTLENDKNDIVVQGIVLKDSEEEDFVILAEGSQKKVKNNNKEDEIKKPEKKKLNVNIDVQEVSLIEPEFQEMDRADQIELEEQNVPEKESKSSTKFFKNIFACFTGKSGKSNERKKKDRGTISLTFPSITPKAVSDIMFGKESTTTKSIKVDELKPIKIGNKKDITVNFKMVPWNKKNNVPGQSSNFRFKQTGAKEFDLLIEENFFKNYKDTLMYRVYQDVEFKKMEKTVVLSKLPPSFDKPEDLTNETKTKGKAEFDSPSMVEALFEVCRIDKDFEALISQIEDYFAVADTWEKLTFVGANDQVQTTIDLGEIEKIKEILEQKKDLFIGMIKGVQEEFNSRSLVGAEKIDAKAIDEISKQETYDRFLKIYS